VNHARHTGDGHTPAEAQRPHTVLAVGLAHGFRVLSKQPRYSHARQRIKGGVRAGCERAAVQDSIRNILASFERFENLRLMDKFDRKILDLLQHDGSLACSPIAERVGLSKAACWRRIKRLQDEGVIKRTVALLNAHALNVGTSVFVMLRTARHNQAWVDTFLAAVRHVPEVTEIHRMSGEIDYLMRIVVSDIAAYDAVYKKLIAAVEFQDVSAGFSLETIKYTTALPLNYMRLE
jgi:Lrp/AsnC family transcriptional regulator